MKRLTNWKEKNKNGVRRAAGRGSVWMLCLALLLAGWLSFGSQNAYAMSCYIDAQPEAAQVGQDVTVTVVFSGDNVGRVRATLDYDPAVLSYQGEGGDTGSVSLYMASDGGDISYSLPFKAVGAGSCALTMTPLDAYDMDEMSMALPEAQSMSVTVDGAPESADSQPAAPEDTEKDDTASDVQEDPQKDAQEQDGQDGTLIEKQEKEERSNTSLYVLIGVAAVFAAALIIVLVRRAKSRYNE